MDEATGERVRGGRRGPRVQALMSPTGDPFGWGGEPAEDPDTQAPAPGGFVRRQRWGPRYGRGVVVFIVVLAAVLALAASLASIGPWAPSTQATPGIGTTSPAGTTSPSASTSPSGTTAPVGTTSPVATTSQTGTASPD